MTGDSPSDCLVSYQRHSFAECLTPLQRCTWCFLQPQPTGPSVLVKGSTPSLALLSGPLWPGVAVPVRVPSMDQINLFENYSYSIGIIIIIKSCPFLAIRPYRTFLHQLASVVLKELKYANFSESANTVVSMN